MRLTSFVVSFLAMSATLPNADVAAEDHIGGGLRRKRHATGAAKESIKIGGDANNIDRELAQRFFFPDKTQETEEDIDMRELIFQMNLSLSMPEPSKSPTRRPTQSPTYSTSAPSVSSPPTLTNCDNPGTCENRLKDQIFDVSVRVGSTAELDDPESAQSRASVWILEECDAVPPIDPCKESQLLLNEQRYALAVMYYSLNGENWNDQTGWLSNDNYCDWQDTVVDGDSEFERLVCDAFGNVKDLSMNGNNLQGEIPPEFGVLVALEIFVASFNAISGSIPTSLGLMSSLQTFDIESNRMDGDQ